MEVFGYLAAVFIGISLGLIGGGGSILTVPVLVYIFSISPVTATAYSLFIVGLTSFIGAVTYMKQGEVSYKAAVAFSLPALTSVYITRKIVIPAIPQNIIGIQDVVITKDFLIMVLFAVLMLAASISMIKNKSEEKTLSDIKFNYPWIAIDGVIVGLFTGLVGAGGGFLIIPALVLLANLPMKAAIGTSLLIITINSLIGFTGDLGNGLIIDWVFLLTIAFIAILGIFIGISLSKIIPGKKLKPAFGWFVLVMGLFILGQNIYKII